MFFINLGFREDTFEYTRIADGVNASVDFADLPEGLVKPEVWPCFEMAW